MAEIEALRADPVTAGRVPGNRSVRNTSGRVTLRRPDRRLFFPRSGIPPAVGPCSPVS